MESRKRASTWVQPWVVYLLELVEQSGFVGGFDAMVLPTDCSYVCLTGSAVRPVHKLRINCPYPTLTSFHLFARRLRRATIHT